MSNEEQNLNEAQTGNSVKADVASSAVANHNDLDVGKCIICRKGVSLFTEKDGEYLHIDLFATSEAGASYKCENSATIGKFLIKNGDRGTLLPNENSKEFFSKQEMWWEDIISLAYDTFKEQSKVAEFFNTGKKGDMIWNKSNAEIENKLLAYASDNGIDVNEDAYPNLIKWKK